MSAKQLTAAISLIAILILSLNDIVNAATLSPILIVHGFSGSQLSVQDESNTDCNTNGETITIWPNATYVATAPECVLRQIKLNNTDNQYLDANDVTVSTENFGSILSIADFSDIFPDDPTAGLIEYFVERGYTVDVNLGAAPYDWRLGAEQLSERGYYSNLKDLIQQMYDNNGNTKVTLVVISMGGPVSLYFLTQVVNQEWKDMYIHSYIGLAAVWSGSSAILTSVLTPPPTGTFLVYPIQASVQDLLSMYRSFASPHWLVPRASAFQDITIVSTPTQNYTSNDYQQLFADAEYPQGYTQISQNDLNFPAPNVSTYCFYGLGFPTPLTFVYDDGFPNTQPTVVFGDGDVSANKESLEVCLRWANSGYPFNRTVFPGVDHVNIISNEAVLQAMGQIVGAPADPINSASQQAILHPLYGVIFALFYGIKLLI